MIVFLSFEMFLSSASIESHVVLFALHQGVHVSLAHTDIIGVLFQAAQE